MKFLFTGGGTLGPVTPLIAVMEELRARDAKAEFVFAGTAAGPERKLVEAGGFRFVTISSPKLRRYFDWRNILAPFHFLAALIDACALIAREKPVVVVGAGGFTSVPIGLAAKLLGKKLLIHQQDVVPSLSNRLLAPFADAITVTFDDSRRAFPAYKTTVTGNPVRPAFERGSREKGLGLLGFHGELPVILVVGGGTGSMFMNELITLGSPLWTDFAEVVHVTGLDKSSVRRPTLTHPERYRVVEFVGEDIVHYYAAADVIISRAGLGTLTELAALSKPVILIPMPDSHQEINAGYVVEHGGARMFRELDLTPEQLVTFTRGLLAQPDDMRKLGQALHGLFAPGARAAVTAKVLSLLGVLY